MTSSVLEPQASSSAAVRLHDLMCPPAHFKVTYSINPWMDPTKPVDLPLALAQWEDLRDRYRALGHTVELLDPSPACPTWSSRPTAPPSSTAGCSAPGSPTGARRRGRRPPRLVPRPRLHRRPRARARQRGRGRLRRHRLLSAGRPGLPLQPALARRGTGVLRPPGHRPRPGGPALLPPGHGAVRARRGDERTIMVLPGGLLPGQPPVLRRLFPDALLADGGGRGRARAERGERRPPRACVPAEAGLIDELGSRGSTASRWTCPSCSRPAAAPSAAPWSSAVPAGPGHLGGDGTECGQ